VPGATTGFVGEMRRAGNGLWLRLISFLRRVPETKGRSLEQIQHDLTGARS
jgi:hypothetical protein